MRLVSDIGGTNVRLAVSSTPGSVELVSTFKIEELTRFEEALTRYKSQHPDLAGFDEGVIAVAGPVIRGRVHMTNVPWDIDRQSISSVLATGHVRIVNDLEAVARAIPELVQEDVEYLKGGPVPPYPGYRVLAVNVGTGFGAAGLIATNTGFVTLPGEPGHILLPLQSEGAGQFATVEDFLSGHGIVDRYRKLAGRSSRIASSDLLLGKVKDLAAFDTVEQFTRALGSICCDLALVHGAWDGVYLTGGVIDGWAANPALFDVFLHSFHRPGPMARRLEQIPVAIIKRPHCALYGLSFINLED